MTNTAKMFVVYGEHICRVYRLPQLNSPILLCPRHSHPVHAPVWYAALLPDVYNCIRTPSLSGDAASKSYNAINTRPTVIHRAFACAKQLPRLLLYTAYLSDTSAAISKCKP